MRQASNAREVLEAGSAGEALEVFERGRVDVLVTSAFPTGTSTTSCGPSANGRQTAEAPCRRSPSPGSRGWRTVGACGSRAFRRTSRSPFAQALNLAKNVGWQGVALTDLSGHQLVNVARPLGTPLPSLTHRDYFQDVIRTGRPAISNVIIGQVTKAAEVIYD